MSTATRTTRKGADCWSPEDWAGWSAHLSQRTTPVEPWRLLSSTCWPLEWAIEHALVSQETRQLIATLARWAASSNRSRPGQIVEHLEGWLAVGGGGRSQEPGFGLECLVWGYVLPRLAAILPAAPWCEALEFLCDVCTSLPDLDLQQNPLAHQWLGGELPLTLSYQFPELGACNRLAVAASKALSAGVNGLLDGNGLPSAEHLHLVRPLLACWTRCSTLSRAGGGRCFDRKGGEQFEWFLRRALHLTRETGVAVFSDIAFTAADQALFDAALRLADDDDRAIADQILPKRPASRRKRSRADLFPESAANSEWGRVSILRPNWLRGSPQLVLAHHGGCMRSELISGEETLWSGVWDLEVVIDGQRLDPPAAWNEVCWFSDDDVDYQEFESQLGAGWELQRQVLLAREDRILFLADALLGPHEARIEYRTGLPLAPGIRFQSAEQTREGRLVGRHPLGAAMPLGLPEWRTARSPGELQSEPGRLQLRQTAYAARTYMPLLIDLDRKRLKRTLTWRQLTVAEKLQIQPACRAVAYRAQIGEDQWLFYRSLVQAANRTVLGQNLSNEFLAARFDCDGDVEDLVRIDTTRADGSDCEC